jgi:pimeloyl-ACP methyl ester carboxylesterase
MHLSASLHIQLLLQEEPVRSYVLVAGAWHGGWIWRGVADRLRAAGHAVTTPTLAGLGDRRHVGQDADLDTHIQDVITHIEMEGLNGITLVGWSYGGMVTTGVLSRIPHKIKAMIYLDAFVPEDGKALIDYLPPELLASWDTLKEEDKPIPPPSLEFFGITDPAHRELISPRLVNHPWRTLYQPVRALTRWPHISITYIHCSGERSHPSLFLETMERMKADPSVQTDVIKTGHFFMLTDLDSTIRLLDRYGG